MKSEVIVTEKELPREVVQAIKKGRKIVAIKLLREATGLGLANAKVLVDRASLKFPGKSPAPAIIETQGHAVSFLAMLLVVALIYVLYRFFLNG
jgi:hypothetical protein